MTWRDRMRPADYKGVGFYVDAHSVAQARRVLVRRLAGQNGSRQHDLGLDPVELDITASLFGDDYDLARDELERTLVEGGPGWLTLPTRGRLWARVTRGPQTSETRDAGGTCTIRFGVVVEERELPRRGVYARPDTSAQLTASAAALRDTTKTSFAETVSTRGLPATYLTATRGAITGALELAGRVQVRASELMAPISEAARVIDAVRDSAVTLLSVPSDLATRLVDVVTSAFALSDAVISSVDALSGVPSTLASPFARGRGARMLDAAAAAFRGFGEPLASRGDSALAARADANTRSVTTLVRTAALSRAADGFAKVAFDSSSQATGVLERMLSEVDALELVASDDVFDALERLRAALTAHLLETASRLPDVRPYRVAEPCPALLISYQLYGSLAMEGDLIARNRLSDPLRARGTLEVIAP
jgi:prophage DNA circulation protein